MRLSDLQKKDVVNVNDGKRIGSIIDIHINEEGSMDEIIIEKSAFLVSIFSSKNEISIKWEQIKKIGEDVILVDINA